jgi:hypothetical protein
MKEGSTPLPASVAKPWAAANTARRDRLHAVGSAARFHCDIKALKAEST